jgi:hypothetical protein
MLKSQWLPVSLVLGLALSPTSAKANEIVPGGSGFPDVFSLGYSSDLGRTVLAVTETNAKVTWGSGSFTGSFYQQVESDPANPFCGGCLDFIFQFENDFSSTQDITRITLAGFSGYRTDLGYDLLSVGSRNQCGPDDEAFCNSGDPATVPTKVDRSADGDVVGFDFPGVSPNESSVDLVIYVNATSFTDPLITFYGGNGGLATLAGFGPSGPPVSAVPEPSTILCLATALFGLLSRAAANRRRASVVGRKG